MKEDRAHRQAIIKTLAYSDLFDYPLTQTEIWQRLIAPEASAISKKLFDSALEKLVKSKTVASDNNFYFLPHRNKICQLRKQREKISREKKGQAVRLISWLQKIPLIQMIALTGALAMKNADKEDDIDLLIITSRHRLWLTRLLLTGLTDFLGIRRRPGQKSAQDKLCLNIFLDSNALVLTSEKRNLYTAYEIVQIEPILDRKDIYRKFLWRNHGWIKRYLPNFFKTEKKPINFNSEPLMLETQKPWFDLLESLAYKLQIWYMKPRLTRETVTAKTAFFHPQDRSQKILNDFKRHFKCGTRYRPQKEV